MSAKFFEEEVHEFIFKKSLKALIDDVAGSPIGTPDPVPGSALSGQADEEALLELWRIVKARVVAKLHQLHKSVRYGEFIGSKLKLPIDSSRPMELDLLGQHEGGLFVLELKVDRGAERNAFSELFAYSNYVAQMFAMSGPKDITNVLVANLDAKITREAYLYDLLISDRDVIVYKPVFPAGTLESLRLQLHIPADADFQHLTNRLLAHEAMSCVVASFDDLPGWFDNKENDGQLNPYTVEHLEHLTGYAAQLMEAEHLHGFCYIRKHWKELPFSHRSSLILCAVNPFRVADPDMSGPLLEQIDPEYHETLFEVPDAAFLDRLLVVARRAVEDCLPQGHHYDREVPLWSGMVRSMIETVTVHNFGFRPTGLFREAYVAHLNRQYALEAAVGTVEDLSTMKAVEITNWLHAWRFMEACGFVDGEADECDDSDPSDSGE